MLQEGSHNLIPEPATRCGSSYRWFHYSGDCSGRVSWELPNWISGCYTDLSSEPPKSQETFLGKCFQKKLDSFCFTVINKHNGSTGWRGQIQTWNSGKFHGLSTGSRFPPPIPPRISAPCHEAGKAEPCCRMDSHPGFQQPVAWTPSAETTSSSAENIQRCHSCDQCFSPNMSSTDKSSHHRGFLLYKKSLGQYQFRWFTHSNYWNMVIFHS